MKMMKMIIMVKNNMNYLIIKSIYYKLGKINKLNNNNNNNCLINQEKE